MFFSTSAQDSFRSPLLQSKQLLAGARSKSVQDIHDSNAYYKAPEAPMYQRSMCTYAQDFVPRPLGGCQATSESCKLFKDKSETVTMKPAPGSLQKDTSNSKSYPALSPEACQRAIMQPFVPTGNLQVAAGVKMMVTDSDTHSKYQFPSPDMMKLARGDSFKPGQTGQRAMPFISSTSYNNEFRASKYGWKGAGALGSKNKCAPPMTGYTGKMKADSAHELDIESFCRGDLLSYEHL